MPLQLFDQVSIVTDWKMVEMADALRAVLESFRLRVQFIRLVQWRQARDFFAAGPPAGCNWTVLVCHGHTENDATSIRFECVDQMDGDYENPEGWGPRPFDLDASNIVDQVAGRGTLVSLSCGGGASSLAQAFLRSGFDGYVAAQTPDDYHDTNGATLFAVGLFYFLMEKDYADPVGDARAAVELAAAMDPTFDLGTRPFRYFGKSSGDREGSRPAATGKGG